MVDKVVSLSEWKNGRGSQNTPSSTPRQQEGNCFNPRPSLLEDVIMRVAEATGEEGKDNPMKRIGLVLSMESRLSRLEFSKNRGKIAEARALTQTYDDEMIFGLLQKATDSDLRMRPSFYFGLVEVARTRM